MRRLGRGSQPLPVKLSVPELRRIDVGLPSASSHQLHDSSRQLRGYRPVVIGVDGKKNLQPFVEERSRTDDELRRT